MLQEFIVYYREKRRGERKRERERMSLLILAEK
jgi:hypothetical protein